MSLYLLDTCALIFLRRREPLRPGVEDVLLGAGEAGRLYLSAVSAWEIGLLSRKPGAAFVPTVQSWLAATVDGIFIKPTPLTHSQALESTLLPDLHADPADRMLVATARDLGAVLVTRDARLLAYAEAGHVQALAC